ncbi:alpha/beta hydrolase [Kordiimonas laminariae]|uniref:alpha/beta hydrolase n=1 Tax=Kordiimonas laminariae TaxID=2917717 RepID=UPI001FF40FDF|nr:alpha/beta hydrolase [Kordiimonas laminariae]MCK0070757.1 alpha/beta hydrolase [Kordiimonas laminariae]
MKTLSDIDYGQHTAQTMDVYIPEGADGAPMIFMVHGGGWRGGDKANSGEVDSKITHWVKNGFVFVSTNYRTLPEADPVTQASDVAAALLFAQKQAHVWGSDPAKVILMGHSAGAHLVSLVSAQYSTGAAKLLKPLLGTVSLDITGYDIVEKFTPPNHSEFYERNFGTDPEYLKKASPFYALKAQIPPFLAVCSIHTATACAQSEKFVKKLQSYGGYAGLISVNLKHMPLNAELGKVGCFTAEVDRFLRKLDPGIAGLLPHQKADAQRECVLVKGLEG